MKTHWINVYQNEKRGEFFIHEGDVHYSKEDAIRGMYNSFPYSHTLEVSLEYVKRIDLELDPLWAQIDAELKDYTPDYERLTGHEMGLISGRV